jgi:hypothetical protein
MKLISVLPNPWLALDANGCPCAVVPFDVHVHAPTRRWVGAKLSVEQTREQLTERIGKYTQVTQDSRHAHRWTFATDPVQIPVSDYYTDRIRCGELVVADSASAELLGVPFREPAAFLAASKAKAISDYDAQHGAGIWASMHPEDAPAQTTEPSTSTAAKSGKRNTQQA